MADIITKTFDIWTTAQALKTNNRGRSASNQSLLGIKKLRELILELAVRGKLVSQDPSEESASELLRCIAKEKIRLLKEGKIKKQEALAEIGDDEKSFDLPEGWKWVRVGNLGYTQTGGTPSKNDKSLFGHDIPFIKPGDIYPDHVDYSNEGLSFKGAESLGRIAPEGSILMVCIGTIGKSNSINRACAFNQQINSLSPYMGSSEYMLFALNSKYFQDKAWEKSSSTTIAIINKGKWENIGLPLPPLAEQHRIVAKVDELMALCDQLEQQQNESNVAHQTLVEILLGTLTNAENSTEFDESWRRIAAHFDTLFTTEHSIDQLKQTILQLAVMGKLTPQNPEDEPASFLITRFKAKRNKLLGEGKVQKAKFLQTIDKEEIPFTIPNTWVWTRLSFIAEVIDPNPSHRMPVYVETGIPFISTENFTDNDKINFSIGKKVTEITLREQVERFEIRVGTFALTRIGTIGKTISLPLSRDYCISHALCVISPFTNELNTDYLRLVVSADSILAQAHSETKSIGVPDLGMGSVRSFLIPMSPLAEQQRIVDKVDELLTLCDALKELINQAQTTQNQLAGAVVEQALSTQPKENVSYTIEEQINLAAEPE